MALFADNESTQTTGPLGLVTKPILSYEQVVIFSWLIFTALCLPICLLGLVTNVINIVCFVQQGFKDPINVSLLGLAVSDIGCLLTMTLGNIFFTPLVRSADLSYDPVEFSYLTCGMPHTAFSRITGWITALITLERCLCIIAPLKVKSIVTTKRMTTLVVMIFLLLIASAAPVYVVNKLGMKFFPDKNKTVIGLLYSENRDIVEKFAFGISNVVLPFTSFVIIIVCTAILAVVLRKKSKWRQKSTSSQADNVSTRNQKVAKMVVMISSLFIACYVPIIIIFMGMCLVPGFSLYGENKDLLFVVGGVCFILESINSSVNIFIYYKMSSKYRVIFHLISCVSR